jgi:hypothetical protein
MVLLLVWQLLLSQAEEERVAWEPAGAKGITFLMAQLQGE